MKQHTLDIYEVDLWLVTNPRDWTTLRKNLTWLDKKPNVDSCGSVAFDVDHPSNGLPIPHLVVWLDTARLAEPAALIETCAHEASHGAGLILKFVGHKVRELDEPHAYLVGWLTRWMWAEVGT